MYNSILPYFGQQNQSSFRIFYLWSKYIYKIYLTNKSSTTRFKWKMINSTINKIENFRKLKIDYS